MADKHRSQYGGGGGYGGYNGGGSSGPGYGGQSPKKSSKMQRRKQVQISSEMVTDRQMFFDQLDDTLTTINSYLNTVKKGHAQSSKGKVLSSLCATSLNCFGLSSNERHSEKDKRALVLASNKLDQWIKNQNFKQFEYEAISPMLKYIHCCIEREVDLDNEGIGTLDNSKAYGENFNEKNVNKGASQYLGSNHVIKERAQRYNKNYQYIDKMHNDEYNKFGGKNAKVFNDTQLPSSDDIYRTSVKHPKYRDFTQKTVERPDMDIDNNNDDDDHKCNDSNHGSSNSRSGRSKQKNSNKKSYYY